MTQQAKLEEELTTRSFWFRKWRRKKAAAVLCNEPCKNEQALLSLLNAFRKEEDDEIRQVIAASIKNYSAPQYQPVIWQQYLKKPFESLGHLLAEQKWLPPDFETALVIIREEGEKYHHVRECAVAFLHTIQNSADIRRIFTLYFVVRNKNSFTALNNLIVEQKWLPPDLDAALTILQETTNKYGSLRELAIQFLQGVQAKSDIERIFSTCLYTENGASFEALAHLITEQKWLPPNSDTALTILKTDKYADLQEMAVPVLEQSQNQVEIDQVFQLYLLAKRGNNIVKQDLLRPALARQDWLPSRLDDLIALLEETNVSILVRAKAALKKIKDHRVIDSVCRTFMRTRAAGLGQFVAESGWTPGEAGEAFVMELLLHETFGGNQRDALIDLVAGEQEHKAVLERYKYLSVEYKKRLLTILREQFDSDALFCKLIRRETESAIFQEMCRQLDSDICRNALFKRAARLKGFTGALIVKCLAQRNWSPSQYHEKEAFESWRALIASFQENCRKQSIGHDTE